jgi:hypothetical protein
VLPRDLFLVTVVERVVLHKEASQIRRLGTDALCTKLKAVLKGLSRAVPEIKAMDPDISVSTSHCDAIQ